MFLSNIHLGVEFSSSIDMLCWCFMQCSGLLIKQLYHFTFQLAMSESSNSPHFHSQLLLTLFDYDEPFLSAIQSESIPQQKFNLIPGKEVTNVMTVLDMLCHLGSSCIHSCGGWYYWLSFHIPLGHLCGFTEEFLLLEVLNNKKDLEESEVKLSTDWLCVGPLSETCCYCSAWAVGKQMYSTKLWNTLIERLRKDPCKDGLASGKESMFVCHDIFPNSNLFFLS